MKYGELTKQYLADEARLEIETQHTISNGGDSLRNTVTLKSRSGQVINSASSKISIDRALELLEDKLVERKEKQNRDKRPYAQLCVEVDNIREKYFFNRDDVDVLSSKATFRGWDIQRWEGDKAIIKVHNAANVLMEFDLLQNLMNVNMNLFNLSLWREADKQAFAELTRAIEEYLDKPLEVRKEELGVLTKKEME